MPHPGEHPTGEAQARRPGSGADAPGGAVGPQDRAIPELADLADSPEGLRIEQKLRAEALARRRAEDEDEEASIDDSTGHA